MFTNDLIDKKIQILFDYHNEVFDETDESDFIYYAEVREFAEQYGGLLFPFDGEIYLVLNFINDEDFLIIPVDFPL